ncbi:MAG: acyl carrier protein [Dehalococcoidia bacterium]|nr:acyl carrier protein [Dehalococcoidia bacterium]
MPTEDTIKDIVVKIIHCDRELLTSDSTFKELEADSLDLVQILVALEDEFNIEIPEEDAQGLTTFGGFVDYVNNKVAEKS